LQVFIKNLASCGKTEILFSKYGWISAAKKKHLKEGLYLLTDLIEIFLLVKYD